MEVGGRKTNAMGLKEAELLLEEGMRRGYFGDFAAGSEGYFGDSGGAEGRREGGDLEARGEGVRGSLGIRRLGVERESRGERGESGHRRGREGSGNISLPERGKKERRGVIWGIGRVSRNGLQSLILFVQSAP